MRTNNSEEGWFKSTWYTRVPPGSYLQQIMASSRKYHDRMKLNLNLYKGQIPEISVVSWPTKDKLYSVIKKDGLNFLVYISKLELVANMI